MAVLDPRKAISNLKKKGFIDARNKSKDHIRLEFWFDGKLTRSQTKFSHNAQEINDYLIGQMSKLVCLTRKQFVDLVECPLSKSEYEKILKQLGFV